MPYHQKAGQKPHVGTPRPQLPEDILTTWTVTAKVKPHSLTKRKQINKTTNVGAKMIFFSLKSTDWNAGDTEAEHPLKKIKGSSQRKGKCILNKSCISRVATICSDLTTRKLSFIHSFICSTNITEHLPRARNCPGPWKCDGSKANKALLSPRAYSLFLMPPLFLWWHRWF